MSNDVGLSKSESLTDLQRSIKTRDNEIKSLADRCQNFEQQYEFLFQQSSALILVIGKNGLIQDVNQRMLKILNYPKDQVIGCSPLDFAVTEKREEFAIIIKKIFEEPKSPEFECELLSKDHNVKTVLFSAGHFKLQNNGSFSGILISGIDITQQKKIQERLRQVQKMEAMGRLASGIAHDFNNLLSVITGYTEMLILNNCEDEKLNENSQEILATVKKATSLIKQLATFSAESSFLPQPLDLSQLVFEIDKMFRSSLVRPGVKFKVEVKSQLDLINADKNQLQLALLNLIINAQHAIQAKSENNGVDSPGLIKIILRNFTINTEILDLFPNGRVGQFIQIVIWDDGIGIRREHISKVFEPFFTTKKKGEGTGLGLAMVYGIIRQHQGWIDVSSELGRGATFALYLPVYKSTKKINKICKSKPPELFQYYLGNGEKILLVEDDVDLARAFEKILLRTNYQVYLAYNAIQAQEYFEKYHDDFDLLIADLILPDYSGFDLAVELQEKKSRLRVIITSGRSDEISKLRQTVKADDLIFLEKPCEMIEMLKLLKKILA